MTASMTKSRLRYGLHYIAMPLLIWAITRLVALRSAYSSGGGFDISVYKGWVISFTQGTFPVDDILFQYPPGSVFLYFLGPADDAFFERVIVANLICDLMLLVTLIVFAIRRNSRTFTGVWVWAISAIFLGDLLFTRFDTIVALLACWGLLAARATFKGVPRDRTARIVGGALLGIAAFIKVWPLFIVLALRRGRIIMASAGFVLAVIGAWIAVAMQWTGSLAFLTSQSQRGLAVEAVPSTPFVVANLLWRNQIVQGGGATVEFVGTLPTTVATLSSILAIALIGAVGWLRFTKRLECVSTFDLAFIIILIFVCFNHVNSPQYMIWLIALAAFSLADPKSKVRRQTWLCLISAWIAIEGFSDAITLDRLGLLHTGDAYQSILQLGRTSLLVLALLISARVLAQAVRGSRRALSDSLDHTLGT